MKVLLVRPGAPNNLSFTDILKSEPLELEYLHTALMQSGYEDLIYDAVCENRPLMSVVRKYRPDVVAMTGYITQERVIKRLCQTIKKWDSSVVTVVGGVHAQLNYQRFYDEAIDYIARSESMDAFVDLIKHLDKKLPTSALREINGLCFRDVGREWQVNPLQAISIDSLPIPDRSFFERNKEHFRYLDLTGIASVKTAFSCPYRCNFCYCALLHQGQYQVRNIESVVEEIRSISADNIYIVDDDFLLDVRRIRTFIRLIREYDIRKTYVCYARADFAAQHPELIEELAAIGFRYFMMGLEAVCDEDLIRYNKGIQTEQNAKAVSVVLQAGAEPIGLMIVGMESRKEDFDRIYDWAASCGLFHVTVSIFTPIPGTPLYEEYKDRLITDDIEKWDFLHLVLQPQYMSRGQFYSYYYRMVLRLYIRARRAGFYGFMNGRYFWQTLKRYWYRKFYLDR